MLRSVYKKIPRSEERKNSHRNSNLEGVTIERSSTQNQLLENLRSEVINNKITTETIFADGIVNQFDGTTLKKPILLLACEGLGDFERVNDETVKLLIEIGADIGYIDQEWYGWEALHYAASTSNPKKLKVICDKLGPNKINTMTMYSENALHVLFRYSLKSFTVLCENGSDLQMANIITSEENSNIINEEDVFNCAQILIDANIDINHSNFFNETPILIAIKYKRFRIVKLLLTKKNIDLDSCKDAVCGKSARELLKGREDLMVLPLPSDIPSPEKILFQILKSGNEEAFVKYNSGKIKDFANSLDGDNMENSSCTLLQYCFLRTLTIWHQDKLTYDCDLQFLYQDVTANRMVQIFCQTGIPKSVQHLLDNGADVDLCLKKFMGGKSVLEAAIIKGFYPMVALILGQNDSLSSEKFVKICEAMNELLAQTNISNVDLNNTVSVVLNRLNCIELKRDSTALKELKKVLKNGVRLINKENILLLLDFPGFLCWSQDENKKGKHVLEEIDRDILRTHLDNCVGQKGKDVYIDCTSSLKDNSVDSVFQTFLSSPGLKEFFNHVVFKILIMRQWKQLRLRWGCCNMKYFYVNFYFYIFFYVVLNLYIVFKFNDTPNLVLYILGLICFVIFICKEVFQIVANFKYYWKDYSNYSEIVFIACTLVVYGPNFKWMDVADVLSILSSNLVLLFLLVSVPSFAKYIIILKTIIFYLRYIFFYFIQFLAFALSFYILFAKKNQVFYKDIPNKIYETIILFTGNLDQMKTPWAEESGNNTSNLYHDFEGKEFFSKIVFILFVLFIAVILQNLLTGLLVIDIEKVQKDVAVSEQFKRASFIVRIATFFNSSCLNDNFVRQFLGYNKVEVKTEIIIVDDDDRKILTEDEIQNLDFILTKKRKTSNSLNKLKKYIRTRINERICDGQGNNKNKEVFEKLEMMVEMVKNLHEKSDVLKDLYEKSDLMKK